MPGWVAPAIEAVGALGAAATGGLLSYNVAAKNRSWQTRMYFQQLEDNRENWQRVADYNLPSAELQRLKDAGLNPLLYYQNPGSSGASPVQAGNVPGSPNLPDFRFQNPLGGFSEAYARMRLLDAQKENLEADSMKKINEALKASADTVKSHQETENLGQEFKFNMETWRLRVEEKQYENNLKVALEQTEVSKRNEMEESMRKMIKEVEFIDNQVVNNNRLTDQQIKESNQRIENSIKELKHSIGLMDAQAAHAAADAYYTRAMAAIASDPRYKSAAIEKEVQAVRNMIAQRDLNGLEKQLRKFKYEMLPTSDSWYDKIGYGWKKFVELTVGPIGDILSGVLGGIGAAAVK